MQPVGDCVTEPERERVRETLVVALREPVGDTVKLNEPVGVALSDRVDAELDEELRDWELDTVALTQREVEGVAVPEALSPEPEALAR